MSRLFLWIAGATALFLMPSNAQQGAMAELGDVEIFDIDDEVRLNVELTRPVPWRVWFEDAPPRLVVEFTDLDVEDDPRTSSTSVSEVTVERAGSRQAEIIATLREPLAIRSAEMIADNGKALLDIRLEPSTASAFREDADQAKTAEPLPVVALDPGHGGIDPGAEAGALDEADLVLTFAEKLRDELLRSGRFNVVLTRDDDQFVSLDERLTRARAADADMFLSIHADALDGADASGMVVYSLDPRAEQRATTRMTERHGDDDLLKGVDLSGAGDDVAEALIDLARRDNAPRTEALSSALVDAFRTSGLVVNARPERHGDFAVLKAADMPSVLLELGFLSTEQDLERLTSDEWQEEASQAIREALTLWRDEDALR